MEFYEDYYQDHPEEGRRVLSKDGEVIFSDTGDPLLDKWEEELAQGIVPDMEEGLSQEEKQRLRKERELSKRARQSAGELDFDEDYAKPKTDPRYNSKFVTPGSKEERALLRTSQVGKASLLGNGMPNDDPADWADMLMGDGSNV